MQMVPFNFDGAAIRAFPLDGDPWFVGKDVAGALGYTNPQKALRDHCKGARPVGVNETFTPPLDPQAVIIPERDVYRLIMRSKLPSAERFEELVVGEILPSIRKTGSFGTVPNLRDPSVLRSLLLASTEEAHALRGQVEELEPKAQALDRIASEDGSLIMVEAAKTLRVRPSDLKEHMLRNRWIYQRPGSTRPLAYQPKIESGLLKHNHSPYERKDGSEGISTQVRVTAKGLTRLARELNVEALPTAH
jgi:anti-repressor protein